MEHQSIHQALAACNKAIDAIGKNSLNQQQGFNFRGIDDAYNALHDILAENGVFTTPRVLEKEYEERQTRSGGALFVTKLMVEYTFWHESGTCITVGPILGEAMDSGDKGANKALAVAHKYALFQTFTIPTLFTDPDSETHEVASELASEEQLKNITDNIDYLPEVTQKWVHDHPKMTAAQAAKIQSLIDRAYAEAAAPAKDGDA